MNITGNKILKNRPGVALIISLMVTVLLTASVVLFIKMSHLEANVADNTYAMVQAEIMAQAGIKAAMTLLAADDTDYDAIIETESWTNFERFALMSGTLFSDGRFLGKIEELSGRLSLNHLIDDKGLVDEAKLAVARRLFERLELDPELTVPILDWLDPDDEYQHGIGGAESPDYRSYPSANGPFDTLNQLTLVSGFSRELVFGTGTVGRLSDHVTVFSAGKININTASQDVLVSLDEEMTDIIAEEIIIRRSEEPFTKVGKVKEISGITPKMFNRLIGLISISSSHFLIQIEGQFRQAKVKRSAVVKKDGAGVKILYYTPG